MSPIHKQLFHLKAIIRGMHDFNLPMGAQSLGAWRRIFLAGGVVVVASVADQMREFLVSLN